MAKPPIKTPKTLVKKIKQAQERINRVQTKRTLVKKADAAPPPKPISKAAQKRQGKEYLSLKDIMLDTTARTRQLMREGAIEVTYINKTKSGRAILCETITHKPNGDTSRYKQVIRNEDPYDAKFSQSDWINAQCDCPQYKFTHDWVLHQKNASDLNYSTDEPPDIRNPRRLVGACKHLYRCFQRIGAKGW